MNEEIHIVGWKGKDEIAIYERKDSFRVVTHHKNKETKALYETERLIDKQNVVNLWKIILKNCDMQTEYKYKYLVRKVVELYNFHKEKGVSIEIMMELFNGGSNRHMYFNYLYFPLKILENFNYILYYGKGGIARISDELELPS